LLARTVGRLKNTFVRILFLHGWHSGAGGMKPAYLREQGHEVLNPALSDDDFEEAVRVAQDAFDRGNPEIVVGSSRGGAVAMNIDSGDTPMVLLCPAWKNWGRAGRVKPNTVILHGTCDETIPFSHSEELISLSGISLDRLVGVEDGHRLAESLDELAACLERVLDR